MPRVKRGVTSRARHQKVLKAAEGYRATRHSLYKKAHESVMRAMAYQFRDRRARKGDMRRIWITRINAAARLNGTTYSQLIAALDTASIPVNRKLLADMAVADPAGFQALVAKAVG